MPDLPDIRQLGIVKQGNCMYGTSHWYGTINGWPAVATAWWGGAAMWVFDGEWKKLAGNFDGLAKLYEYFGIQR
jgi:hypothetical protein